MITKVTAINIDRFVISKQEEIVLECSLAELTTKKAALEKQLSEINLIIQAILENGTLHTTPTREQSNQHTQA